MNASLLTKTPGAITLGRPWHLLDYPRCSAGVFTEESVVFSDLLRMPATCRTPWRSCELVLRL